MKKQFLVLAVVITAAFGCKRNIDQNDNFTPRATKAGHLDAVAGLPEQTLPLVVSSDLTLTSDKLWVLDGKCYVTNGATLQIEEGTYVAAKKKSTSDSASALIVTRGSSITAFGSEDAPVVFTSYESCPHSGDWGGVVLLGQAPLNRADTTIEGINLPSVPAGVDVNYGGGGACQGDTLDNSGVLSYVRIEYAGTIISPDNELNGLTCGGVGRGTTLDHIEVAYGNDDAFEFFGGNVDAKYLIALAPDDDAFDFDFGFQGRIQFAVSILKDGTDVNGVPLNYSANPNGIESDNNATGAAACQQTKPMISNMTVVGFCSSSDASSVPTAGLLNGAQFRRLSSAVVRNSVFMGFPTGVNLNGSSGVDFTYNTVQAFNNTIPSPLDPTNRVIIGSFANDPLIGLASPCTACSPDWRPTGSQTTLTTDAVNYSGLPIKSGSTGFFDVKSYRGACAADNSIDGTWPLKTWAKYDYEPYCIACGE